MALLWPGAPMGARPQSGLRPPGAWVVPYLVAHQLLPPDAARDGAHAEEVSVSHEAFIVRRHIGPDLFVKRADAARSHGRTLHNEVIVYRLAAVAPSLRTVLPRCASIDDARQVLVLESIPGWPLDIASLPSPNDDALVAFGRALARVHTVTPPRFGDVPWLLDALEPRWGGYEWLPPACGDLLARLSRRPDLRAGFRRARDRWRAEGLVHGDLRAANVLLTVASGAPEVRLVDWELACVGDAAWDVGAVLADCVGDGTGGLVASWDEARARAATFLRAYRVARPVEARAWVALVERAVRLAALRLVQTLVECAHAAPWELGRFERAYVPAVSQLLRHAPELGAMLAVDAA